MPSVHWGSLIVGAVLGLVIMHFVGKKVAA